jgi:hypothetical protein
VTNVVQLRPFALSAEDVESVETIALLFIGREIPIRDMEVTQRSLASFRDEHGSPPRSSKAFAFPIYIWPSDANREQRFVVDQGRVRVAYCEPATGQK